MRSSVPESHRAVADNFMIIKKIFGSSVVRSKVTDKERKFLSKYDFNPLEFSTSIQMMEELSILKKWSNSSNKELQDASSDIIHIRTKELRYLIATNYIAIPSELYTGYKVLEKYFESISKYSIER